MGPCENGEPEPRRLDGGQALALMLGGMLCAVIIGAALFSALAQRPGRNRIDELEDRLRVVERQIAFNTGSKMAADAPDAEESAPPAQVVLWTGDLRVTADSQIAADGRVNVTVTNTTEQPVLLSIVWLVGFKDDWGRDVRFDDAHVDDTELPSGASYKHVAKAKSDLRKAKCCIGQCSVYYRRRGEGLRTIDADASLEVPSAAAKDHR